MFFKHFAGKNQLPGFYISGILVENGTFKMNLKCTNWTTRSTWEAELQQLSRMASSILTSMAYYKKRRGCSNEGAFTNKVLNKAFLVL